MNEEQIIEQQHNWLSRFLFSAPIRPIPKERPDSKIERAPISRATWAWLDPLLRTGYDRALVPNDIPKLAKRDALKHRFSDYKKYLEKHESKRFVEIWAFLYAMRWQLFMALFLQVLDQGSGVGLSVLSRNLINETERIDMIGPHSNHGRAVGLAIGNSVLNLLIMFTGCYSMYYGMMMVENGRTLSMAAVHDKMLRLNPQQRHDYSAGKITSMTSSDARRASMSLQYINVMIIFPFYLAAVIGVLIYNIGVSGLAGIALLLLALGCNIGTSALAANFRKKSMPFQDKRVSLTRETIKNMSIIKFYGWEKSFAKVIFAVRSVETKYIRLIWLTMSIVNALVIGSPTYAGALSFAVRVIIGKGLQPSRAFPSLTLFSMFIPLFAEMTMALNAMSDAWVAINRLDAFFRLPETESYIKTLDEKNTDVIFRTINGTFGWFISPEDDENDTKRSPSDNPKKSLFQSIFKLNKEKGESLPETSKEVKVLLTGVNISVRKGSLTLVVGSVGSGKTSLLRTFVETIPLIEGSVECAEDISTASVLSLWSQNSSIRENILFGSDFDTKKYDDVVRMCDLNSDFAQFTHGDATEVGENGVTLSGGQRARLALARCLYADSDLIVLDDVLSAMDARVGNLIFNELLRLIREEQKSVVFSTNNTRLLRQADSIILLDGKGGVTQSSPEEALRNPALAAALNNLSTTVEAAPKQKEDTGIEPVSDANFEMPLGSEGFEREMVESGRMVGEAEVANIEDHEQAQSESMNKEEKQEVLVTVDGLLNMEEEKRAHGSVKTSVIIHYFGLNGFTGAILALGLLTLALSFATSNSMTSVVLNWWTSDKYRESAGFYIGMYCMVAGLNTAFYIAFMNGVTIMNTAASSRLHNSALKGLYAAPMAFFQRNPLGRIMMRFTEDVVNLDTRLMIFTRILFAQAFNLIGSAVLVFVYVPWSLVCLIPILLISFILMSFYRTASRELNRVKQLSDSRVMTCITENIEGQEVIVSYDRVTLSQEVLNERIDDVIAATMCNEGSHFWMALRDGFLCEILTVVTVFLAIFQVFHLSPSDVGMLLSLLPNVANGLCNIFPIFAMFENQLNSVERLSEYANDVEAEGNGREKMEFENWVPGSGKVDFDNVSLRYRNNLPLALNNLSLSVEGGTRLGICGRTGAGKSTILSALFRLVELSGGTIKIDGVDIAEVPLETLRRALSIIPQQPVLFQGTIRSNLDPFEERTDQQLWDALNRAGGLAERDGEKFHLDSHVEAEGSNFSLGERQMLALARALVRDSKILVLDEATAAVDEATDAQIQQTIKKEFMHHTVLCIAHRLETIMDYDHILVMGSGGHVLEIGTPQELLAKGGYFTEMAKEAGIKRLG